MHHWACCITALLEKEVSCLLKSKIPSPYSTWVGEPLVLDLSTRQGVDSYCRSGSSSDLSLGQSCRCHLLPAASPHNTTCCLPPLPCSLLPLPPLFPHCCFPSVWASDLSCPTAAALASVPAPTLTWSQGGGQSQYVLCALSWSHDCEQVVMAGREAALGGKCGGATDTWGAGGWVEVAERAGTRGCSQQGRA